MTEAFDEATYIQRYYGSCSEHPCPCQVDGVRRGLHGEIVMDLKLACTNWTPVKARSWREM